MSGNSLIDATAVNSIPLYAEKQHLALCAKHALNNILQEEKIGYYPNKPLLINKHTGKKISASESILDYHVQLNIWRYCSNSDVDALKSILLDDESVNSSIKNSLKKGIIPDEIVLEDYGLPLCGTAHDDLNFDSVENLVKMLGYKTKVSRAYMQNVERNDDGEPILFKRVFKNASGAEREIEETHTSNDQVPVPGFWDELKSELKKQNLLGVLINKGAWHYTAISKFVKGCSKWDTTNKTRKFKSILYTFLDSYPVINTQCKNMAKLITYLQENEDVNSVIYVYDSPCAYNSVAANRLRRLLASPMRNKTKKANAKK